MVEHNLAKVGVAGSNPVVRSKTVRSGALSEGLFSSRNRRTASIVGAKCIDGYGGKHVVVVPPDR